MQSLLSRSILHHVNRRTNSRVVTFATDKVVVTIRSLSSAAAAESNTTTNPSNTPSSTSTSTTSTTTNNHTGSVENEWMKGALQQLLEQYGNQLKIKDDQTATTTTTTTASSVSMKNGAANDSTKKEVVSDEDLEKSLQYFQYRLNEARHCLNDCTECQQNPIELREEIATAEAALQASATSLLDLLYDLREVSTVQQDKFKQIREDAVVSIRDIRTNLNELKRHIV